MDKKITSKTIQRPRCVAYKGKDRCNKTLTENEVLKYDNVCTACHHDKRVQH